MELNLTKAGWLNCHRPRGRARAGLSVAIHSAYSPIMKEPFPPRCLIFLLALLFIVLLGLQPASAQTEGGDQFLDGIGETALIARYVLNGSAADGSRNNHQATLQGAGATYVEDDKFGKVLSLPGSGNAFLQIPGQALEAVDAITVMGWVFLRSPEPWQRFFDFGLNETTNFFCTPIGDADDEGYRARITTRGWGEEKGPTAPRVATNRWVHLAVVLDAPRQTLTIYHNGTRVGQTTGVETKVEQLLDEDDARRTHLYIGKSQDRKSVV